MHRYFDDLKTTEYMKTPIEMLQSIIDMQKENYGNGMNTHMKLDTLVKEAELIIKNHGDIGDVSQQRELLIDFFDHVQSRYLKNKPTEEYADAYLSEKSIYNG